MIRFLLISSLTILGAASSLAQTEKATPTPTATPVNKSQGTEMATPVANPADVNSIDAIVAAVYDVISGPAGKKRDWDRMRSLFMPGARLVLTGPRQSGGYGSRALTVEDYLTRSAPLFEKQGFFEKKARVARRVSDRLLMSSAPTNRVTLLT